MIQKIAIDCFGFGCCWPLCFTYTRYVSGPILFGTRDWFHRRQFLHWPGVKEWFGDDSSVLHSLCILFLLLLLYHLHLRSSDIRPQRLETPKIWHWANICWIMNTQVKSFLFFSLGFLSSVHSLSHVQLFVTPWTTECQASLSINNSWSSPKLMYIESEMPSNHLILCRPLLLLPPAPPSIRVFPNESALRIRWPKDWSFSFSISPSNEHPGLISFRMGWLDLLAVQGTLKSLLQHHSSKASILYYSAFFIVWLSHPYMTTGKTIALNRGTFVGKVMSLLFNMLSRLVITFLLRSKCL